MTKQDVIEILSVNYFPDIKRTFADRLFPTRPDILRMWENSGSVKSLGLSVVLSGLRRASAQGFDSYPIGGDNGWAHTWYTIVPVDPEIEALLGR